VNGTVKQTVSKFGTVGHKKREAQQQQFSEKTFSENINNE
jgi:hypothetical protein